MKNNTLNHYKIVVENIQQYIRVHINEDLSLIVLSKKFSVSLFHLSRIFKKITGTTLNNYVQKERLHEAFRLITATNVKVNDAAFSTGFNDYETFSRSFKRHFKIAPDDLRKIIKQIKTERNIPKASVVLKSIEVNDQNFLSKKFTNACEYVYTVEISDKAKHGMQKFIISSLN